MLGQVTGGITVLGQVVYSAGTGGIQCWDRWYTMLGQVVYSAGTGDRWYHSAGTGGITVLGQVVYSAGTGGIQCWDR